MKLKSKIINSSKELTSVYSLTALGMLLAIRIILGIFANSTMALFGNAIKISLNFLPITIAGILFGPIGAGIIGALGDVLSFFINPASGGAYFPGFTLNGLLTGLIFGFFLYKKNNKFVNILVAYLINTVFIEILLSGYWLYYIYGTDNDKTFIIFLMARVISELIKAVPTVFLMTLFCKVSVKIPLKT